MTQSTRPTLYLTDIMCCFRLWRFILLSTVFTLPMTALGQPQPLINECSYHHLSNGAMVSTVLSFAKAITQLADSNPDIRSQLEKQQDITNELYQLGLIGVIDGCQHHPGSKNIQVLGGYKIPDGSTRATTQPGFTLVVHALAAGHCNTFLSVREDNNEIKLRPEVPGQAPGKFGECVGNLLLPGMPMPNTLYLYQAVSTPASTVPKTLPDRDRCPGDLFQRAEAIKKACDALAANTSDSKAQTSDYQLCNLGVTQQSDALRLVNKPDTDFASLKADQRTVIIENLIAAYRAGYAGTDSHPYTGQDVIDAVHLLYREARENNIDHDFWAADSEIYDEIALKIRSILGEHGFNLEIISAEWTLRSELEKQHIMQQISDLLLTRLMANKRALIWQLGILNGVFLPSEPEVIRFNGAGLGSWIFGHTLEVVLHESLHAYQYDLSANLFNQQIAKNSHRCVQSRLFLTNLISYSSGSLDRPFDFTTPYLAWLIPEQNRSYFGQPMELHAHTASQYIVKKVME